MINIGIGVSWAKALYSVANNIIANFRARVLSYPNSIFEAGPCLDATLEELNAIGLLDNASLIVTPNAYNEGVLYDVIPNTPLGDMDVVRATTATRVNSAGLIEVVPRNLFTYSQQFTNAAWLDGGGGTAVFTDNFAISPNGTTTAARWTAANINSQVRQNVSTINNTSTISVWMRTNSGTKNATLFINDSAVQLTITVTTTWQRFTLTGATGGTLLGAGRTGFSNNSVLTNSDYIEVWGAQFENFATATEYFPTTTRLNIPRIDYTNGSCPSLLVEPQRTNLALYSEQFNNDIGYISSGRPVITTNIVTSPSGLLDADLLTYANGDSLRNTPSFTFTNAYTYSIFVKKDIGRYVTISGLFFTRSLSVGFDLDTKTCQAGGTVTDFGNGWLRLSISQVVTGDADKNGFFYVYAPNSLGVQDSAAGNRFYAWGCQIEEGTYPTSYIPTIASSVTRNADVLSRTGVSGLIGQTEGTVFVDINVDLSYTQTDMRFINISDGSSTNWWFIGTNVSNQIRFYYKTGATTYVSQLITLTSGRHKLAFAYKSNDYVAYVDGTQVHSLTSLIVGATSQIDLGNNFGGSGVSKQFINSAQLYKTRLTNAELAQLTTL